MGVIIPDDIKVLSSEFKDFVTELANEVNRVSEAYVDLQRTRVLTEEGGGGGGPTDFLFYKVGVGEPGEPEDAGGGFVSVKYNGGTVFDSTGGTVTIIAEDVEGYDYGSVPLSIPSTMPDQANVIGGDPLVPGVVVCCKFYPETNRAVFSSVRPRLRVECVLGIDE